MWNCNQIAAIGLLAVWSCGCGSGPEFKFDDLDVARAQEKLTEFSLGHYSIPIPIVDSQHAEPSAARNRFEFAFDLYAVVSPDQESQVAAAWERHEGKVRDRVISICRNASLEMLQEPELSTLKSHLTDAVQGQLGTVKVRQLLLTDVGSLAI